MTETESHENHEPDPAPDPTPDIGSAPQPGAGSGLEPNVAGALCYILGVLTGILFLIIDGQRPFVRFHALQSIGVSIGFFALGIALAIVSMVLGVIPVIGWLISLLLSLALSGAGLVMWLYLMYRAWQGDMWEAPIVGQRVRNM
jgi:uncharacterized membrane protein